MGIPFNFIVELLLLAFNRYHLHSLYDGKSYFRITGFLDFVHRPVFLKLEKKHFGN
jgi:hypothetical protein